MFYKWLKLHDFKIDEPIFEVIILVNNNCKGFIKLYSTEFIFKMVAQSTT